MRQILVGLLVIFVTNQQVTAQFPISFGNIKTVFQWAYKLYQTGNAYENPDRTQQNVVQILADVEKISSDLTALDAHLDIKLDVMLKTLLSDFEIQSDLQGPKEKLSYYLNIVDRFYESSRKYQYSRSYSNKTLEKFADTVLWGADSLPNTLDNIHHLIDPGQNGHIVPGFTSLMLQASTQNLPTDCNKFVSAQQRMYYILAEIIVAEMTGLAAQIQVLTTSRLIDQTGYNYTNEIAQSRERFEMRLQNYYETFTRDMAYLPRLIRRCDEKLSQRGINFLEFQNFSRSAIFDILHISDNLFICGLECPQNSKLSNISQRTNTTVYDCERIDTEIQICPPEPGSFRNYAWWSTRSGPVHGHKLVNQQCDREMYTFRGSSHSGIMMYEFCGICVCSVDLNRAKKDNSNAMFQISVTDQISNIKNNMVVTGIRFVTYENALHLQIKHAAFSHGGIISKDAEWKRLDQQYHRFSKHPKKKSFRYESLRHDRKSLYLDDIKVPDNYVITGVRFALVNNSGFMLQVHATAFVLETGELNAEQAQWFDATTHPLRPQDYKRKRIEITMGKADDPARGNAFKYDEESNKLIKITHTDVMIDAGQTTIPYIDSQPLETMPSFPLNAIGIFYRGSDGYGGYIAPRLHTYNVTWVLQSSFNQWKETNEVSEGCGLTTPMKIIQNLAGQNVTSVTEPSQVLKDNNVLLQLV